MTPATEALVERLEGDCTNWKQSDQQRAEAATALRALSDRCDALIGYAVHDDDCTVNRYPGHDACSCGLSLILQEARHDHVSDPRQMVSPPPAGEG